MKTDISIATFIGEVAVLRGDIRYSLLCSADWLLASGIYDQGVARIIVPDKDSTDLLVLLLSLLELQPDERRIAREIRRFQSRYSNDLLDATRIATGSWNHLGRVWALFERVEYRGGGLSPSWREFDGTSQQMLIRRLSKARDKAKELSAKIHLTITPRRRA